MRKLKRAQARIRFQFGPPEMADRMEIINIDPAEVGE
jgi:hypothetical protein